MSVPVARTCVNVGVLLHVRLLVEPFATILARIWPTIWTVPTWPRWRGRRLSTNLVSLWIRRWVDSVELRLKHLPHSLHSNSFSALCIALRKISCHMLIEGNFMTHQLVLMFTCVDWDWFHDQMFCCIFHTRKVWNNIIALHVYVYYSRLWIYLLL